MDMANKTTTNASKLRHEADDHADDDTVSQQTWEKLLGSENWDGLIEPHLNIDLRRFILRCGDFCHAAYDAFTAVGFSDVKLPNAARYQVHAFLYATTDLNFVQKILHVPARINPPAAGDHVPNWMGFCAATTDEASRAAGRREIYVAWRGTQRLFEWTNNLLFSKSSAVRLLRDFDKKREPKKPRIMKGWRSIYTSAESSESSFVKTSASEQVKAVVKELLERYSGERISVVVTGQSLGAIMATLSAFDLAENVVGPEIPVAAVVFGCPRVGNEAFKRRVERRGNLRILHVRNRKDVVPHVPVYKYVAMGTELVVDTAKSAVASVSESESPGVWHDLEATLHMVAGWNGPDVAFELRVERDTSRLVRTTKPFLHVKSEIKLWTKRVGTMPQKLIERVERKFKAETSLCER